MPKNADALKESASKLAKDISELQEVISCLIVDKKGKVLGISRGKLDVPKDVQEVEGTLLAVVWGSCRRSSLFLGSPSQLSSNLSG